jgi:tetratricopeptide (TPR) repeat protein
MPRLKYVVLAVVPLIFLLPIYAYAGNHFRCDRSRNYIAYNYAWNILVSADPNAVLFTGGDNDTFPLWCLQDVYKVRTDVAMVCLPLSNTDWYIKQLKNDKGLKLGWTDEQIERLVPYRTPDGTTYRLQDQVVNALMTHERDKRPLNFSVTVSPGGRRYEGQSIDSLLEQRGMVFHVRDHGISMSVDIDRSLELYEGPDGFRYGGFADTTIYKDEANDRAIRNIANAMMLTVDFLQNRHEIEEATQLCRFIPNKIPQYDRAVGYLASLYLDADNLDSLASLAENPRFGSTDDVMLRYAQALRREGNISKAEIILRGILQRSPSDQNALNELTKLYISQKQYGNLDRLFTEWLRANPNDQRVRQMQQRLREAATSSEQDTQYGP